MPSASRGRSSSVSSRAVAPANVEKPDPQRRMAAMKKRRATPQACPADAFQQLVQRVAVGERMVRSVPVGVLVRHAEPRDAQRRRIGKREPRSTPRAPARMASFSASTTAARHQREGASQARGRRPRPRPPRRCEQRGRLFESGLASGIRSTGLRARVASSRARFYGGRTRSAARPRRAPSRSDRAARTPC